MFSFKNVLENITICIVTIMVIIKSCSAAFANDYIGRSDIVLPVNENIYIQYVEKGPDEGKILIGSSVQDLDKVQKAKLIPAEEAINDDYAIWRNAEYGGLKNYRLICHRSTLDPITNVNTSRRYEIGVIQNNFKNSEPVYLLSAGNYDYQRFVASNKKKIICNGYELVIKDDGNFGKIITDISLPPDTSKGSNLIVLTKLELEEYIEKHKRNFRNIYFKLKLNINYIIGRENGKINILDLMKLDSKVDASKVCLWAIDEDELTIINPESNNEYLIVKSNNEVDLGQKDDNSNNKLVYYDNEKKELYYYLDGSNNEKGYLYMKIRLENNNISLEAGKRIELDKNLKQPDLTYYKWEEVNNINDEPQYITKNKKFLNNPVLDGKNFLNKSLSELDNNYTINSN